MQSSRNVTTSSGGGGGSSEEEETEEEGGLDGKTGPELFTGIPDVTVTAEDTGPAGDTRRPGHALMVVDERSLRTPSPLCGANCDDDSEAESFRDGRTEEVDRDTRGRAFTWCRDFLSGPWKTIREDDFQISIVR